MLCGSFAFYRTCGKLLLYGGAINLAGSVKGKRTAKHAVSDWMEIEKQRGISVTSSVLQFKYNGYCINILDTPGHEDFSEDTYRTLMAADSAVMVIDGSKGVEKQTIKLFKVCVMRNIPIITYHPEGGAPTIEGGLPAAAFGKGNRSCIDAALRDEAAARPSTTGVFPEGLVRC